MEAATRICTRCEESKPLTDFGVEKRCKNGRMASCVLCEKERKRDNYIKNRDRYRTRHKKYYLEHKDEICQREKKKNERHPETNRARVILWQKEHPEKAREKNKKWKLNNPDRYRFNEKNYRERFKDTPKWKLSGAMRTALNQSLRRQKNGRHWEDLLNFTVEQLRSHLEKLFKPGMTWGNYGKVWEIDHKIPIAVFNYERPDDLDFRLCWSLKNLQPLETTVNRSKQAKIETPIQPSLRISTRGIAGQTAK